MGKTGIFKQEEIILFNHDTDEKIQVEFTRVLTETKMLGKSIYRAYPCMHDTYDYETIQEITGALDTQMGHWFILLECTDGDFIRLDFTPGKKHIYCTKLEDARYFEGRIGDAIKSEVNTFEVGDANNRISLSKYLVNISRMIPSAYHIPHPRLKTLGLTGLEYYTCQEFIIDCVRELGMYEGEHVFSKALRSLARNHVISPFKALAKMYRVARKKRNPAWRVNKRHFRSLFWYEKDGEKIQLMPDVRGDSIRAKTDYIPGVSTLYTISGPIVGAVRDYRSYRRRKNQPPKPVVPFSNTCVLPMIEVDEEDEKIDEQGWTKSFRKGMTVQVVNLASTHHLMGKIGTVTRVDPKTNRYAGGCFVHIDGTEYLLKENTIVQLGLSKAVLEELLLRKTTKVTEHIKKDNKTSEENQFKIELL